MTRRRLSLTLALLAAFAVGGCYPLTLVQDDAGTQKDVVGDVVLKTRSCQNQFGGLVLVLLATNTFRASDTRGFGGIEDGFRCLSDEETTELTDELPTLPQQVLATYRVPAGAKAPDSFTAEATVLNNFEEGGLRRRDLSAMVRDVRAGRGADQATRSTQTVTFRRDASLQTATRALYEEDNGFLGVEGTVVGDGQQLVGYRSDVVQGVIAGDLKLEVPFGLPDGPASDRPYAGPFGHLALQGVRFAFPDSFFEVTTRGASEEDVLRAATDPDRPVDCLTEADLLGLNTPRLRGGLPEEEFILTLLSNAICPTPKGAFSFGLGRGVTSDDLLDGGAIETRDLRVVGGGEGFAEQGQTATVPFKLRTAGAQLGGAELELSGSSALEGASVTPTGSTDFPATGEHASNVDVAVPAAAAPGTYDVTLTVKRGAVSRSAKGSVVVLPKPVIVSAASLPSRDTLWMDREGDIAYGYVCDGTPAKPCGTVTDTSLSFKQGIAPTATTAQVTKPRLLIIGKGRFRARAGTRVRRQLRLYPKAQRAVRRGRQVKGLVIVRGSDGAPVVRRVVIKKKRR